MDKVRISVILPVKPAKIYNAWMDSKTHSAMTGGEAKINPLVGGRFTAWDDYIQGTTELLEPNKRIIQKWRTTEFPDGSPDSIIEIIFESVEKGTKVTVIHTEIPDGQGNYYKKGWKDFYFTPMKSFFKE